jgi:hypothetical protein
LEFGIPYPKYCESARRVNRQSCHAKERRFDRAFPAARSSRKWTCQNARGRDTQPGLRHGLLELHKPFGAPVANGLSDVAVYQPIGASARAAARFEPDLGIRPVFCRGNFRAVPDISDTPIFASAPAWLSSVGCAFHRARDPGAANDLDGSNENACAMVVRATGKACAKKSAASHRGSQGTAPARCSRRPRQHARTKGADAG